MGVSSGDQDSSSPTGIVPEFVLELVSKVASASGSMTGRWVGG
jgi:hypothetical protein